MQNRHRASLGSSISVHWNEIAKVPPYQFCVSHELWCDCHRQSMILIRCAEHHPHPPRLRRATIAFHGIAATGSYSDSDSLRDAPPQGKALFPNIPQY